MSLSQSHVNRSNTSQLSRSMSQYTNDLEELTDEELVKQVQDLKQQIKIVSLENEIIEKTMLRCDPTLLQGVQQALDYASRLHSNTSLNVGSFVKSQQSKLLFESFTSPSRMLLSTSKVFSKRAESSARLGGTVIFGSGPRINVLERSELVSTEMEIVVSNLKMIRNNAAKQHALLKAQLEEIDIRVDDIKKANDIFKQEVIIDGWDKIAQRIPAEIWIRYMSEWMKTIDSKIGKLRLRTSTLNTQYSKLKSQIKMKAELSESLRPVDFDKIKIENGECLNIIDQKLQQLAELKKMTGDANLILTIHKKSLMEQNTYLTQIANSVVSKQKQTVELNKEREKIQTQVDSLEQKLNEVKKLRMAYEVPDVMEYVYIKANVADLKHNVKLLQNRLRILQIALMSHHKKLTTMFLNG